MSSDELKTSKLVFSELNTEFHFCVDLCATKSNKKTIWYCEDYLNANIKRYEVLCRYNGTAFMSPPYSRPFLFVEKAWEDSKYCKIVCLLTCDTSNKTWGIFWDYESHKPKSGCEIRFLPTRLKFKISRTPSKYTANVASAIIIFDRRHL